MEITRLHIYESSLILILDLNPHILSLKDWLKKNRNPLCIFVRCLKIWCLKFSNVSLKRLWSLVCCPLSCLWPADSWSDITLVQAHVSTVQCQYHGVLVIVLVVILVVPLKPVGDNNSEYKHISEILDGDNNNWDKWDNDNVTLWKYF